MSNFDALLIVANVYIASSMPRPLALAFGCVFLALAVGAKVVELA